MPDIQTETSAPRSLDDRLAVIRSRYPELEPGMVVDVVRAVLGSMQNRFLQLHCQAVDGHEHLVDRLRILRTGLARCV